MTYDEKALEIYGNLSDEGLTDEDIAEISLALYDISGVDLSEEVPDGEAIH